MWKSVGDKYLYGIAKCHFFQEKPHRLSLDVGDAVIILKENTNWYYGYNQKSPGVRGIFPKNYIHLLECVKTKNDYVIKRSEIVDEITTVLQEWGDLFKRFFLTNNDSFQPIREKMLELIRLRSQILSGNLPIDEMKEVKLLATSGIDTGNKLLGQDMVVRNDNGNILDINATSTTQLYQHHMNAVNRIQMASTSFNKNQSSRQMNKHSHNLLVSVHAFVCKFQEDSDLLLTLYDADKNKTITENYVVKWGRLGLARNLDQFDNNRVLFTDLSSQDLKRNRIFLVCYAIRIGGMDFKELDHKRTSSVLPLSNKRHLLSNSNNGGGCENMRRPFGVAAIDLTPIISKPDDFKSKLDLPFILCEKENLDNTLRKLILNKDIGKNDSKLAVSVEVLHGDSKQFREEYPHLVHGNVYFARKMGFPEVILPGDVRNDLYLTLVGGEFSKISKSSEKNIEVTVAVCNEKGVIMSNAITLGAGSALQDEYKSVIYYHDDKPKWNETFKIQVPIEEFKQCHLKLTFRHRSTNETKDRSETPFALSYVKLKQNNGTILQNNFHQLIIYRIDQKKFDKETSLNYLSLPSLISELENKSKPTAVGFTINSKDFLTIYTNLCSTKLTQDVALLGLLNWSPYSEKMDELEESLNAIMDVKPEEVVKFLQGILDVLFNILVQNTNPAKYDELVFKCLLRLIEIVSDLKYQHFQSVLDLYINESFSATLAYDKLINVLQTHIKNAINLSTNVRQSNFGTVSENEIETLLYKTTKNLQYIMKFIIRSRILFANMTDDKDRNFFERSLEDLLKSFENLIACPNYLLRSQGALLKYLHIIASDLMQVYDSKKLSQSIVDIITHIPQGRLTQSKMICIKDLIDSKLFKLPECRAILLPVFCRQIKDKLESKEEGDIMSDLWQQEKNLTKAAKVLGELKSNLHTRETTAKTKVSECVNILNHMLELLCRNDIGPNENDIKDIMLILLKTIIQTSIQMDRDNPLVGNLVAIMLGIFRSMQAIHYNIFVSSFATRYELLDFLSEILPVFKDLVSQPVYPQDWIDMIMHQNTVILESLKHFTIIIIDNFLNPFEKQVWSNFFHCSIEFLLQPYLQLEQFTTNKKSTILSRYKDIRKETAYEIRKMWFTLGEYKTRFVPELVGSILEMSLIPEPDLRRETIPIFFDMMQCEYYTSKYIIESYGDTRRNNLHYKGNFNDFEKEMIEKLDILVEKGRGDHEYKTMFNKIMMDLCTSHNTLKDEGSKFVGIVTKLLERLLEYRCIIQDESKENRMACTVSLLQFYSEVNRKEMYIRYVNKLCDLHMEFENYTEAAFTLMLHSNLLKWNDTPLSSLLRSERHPHCQTHLQLKEALFNEIINYFDKGKMWECALNMCKELINQYEDELFDYCSLSVIHKKMAEFYEKILKEMRHTSEYFRVAFYGLSFPKFLCNKVFIYRGKEYEKYSDFCSRILTQHPSAELMQTLTRPGPEITENEGRYILINGVEPMMENIRFSDKKVSSQIMKYYETNNVQKFKFSRPFVDGDRDNVANLWLERTIMKTTDPLPGILRWFPVESTETFKISPIEHAIEIMETTNKQIRDLVVAHCNDPTLSINPLSMKINGIVDPAVMGGFTKYEEAFLTDEYLEENPNNVHLVGKLKELIVQQIPLLEYAVNVHRNKAPNNLIQFHNHMEKCFFEMQAKVETKYGKATSDLKFDSDSYVTMRRQGMSIQFSVDSNRLSETSMGSNDSGLSKSTQNSRPATTSSIKSTFANFNFNTNLPRTSLGVSPNTKKTKEKTPKKGRTKSERVSVMLPGNNSASCSQWYATSLTSISSTPSEKDVSFTGSVSSMTTINTTVVELNEELTPKRPLRSEIERERRLSRPNSMATPTSAIKGISADTHSISGEDSNRNSIVTTDSTASDEDPPPLPAKTPRDSVDYTNLSENSESTYCHHRTRTSTDSYFKPLPAIPVSDNYDYVEVRNSCLEGKRRPPTPPPKPARISKTVRA